MLKTSGVCGNPFTPALLKEGFWLAPWPGARSVAAPRSDPLPPPQPWGMLAARSPPSEPPAAAAGSRTGRGSSGRVLRAGGDRGYPLHPGARGGGFSHAPLGAQLPWELLAGIVPAPIPGATCSGRGGPSRGAGGLAVRVCLVMMCVCAAGSDPHAPSPAALSPLLSGRKKRGEDLGQGSPAQQRAAAPRRLGGRLNPGLQLANAFLSVPAPTALGTLALAGLPRPPGWGGLLSPGLPLPCHLPPPVPVLRLVLPSSASV